MLLSIMIAASAAACGGAPAPSASPTPEPRAAASARASASAEACGHVAVAVTGTVERMGYKLGYPGGMLLLKVSQVTVGPPSLRAWTIAVFMTPPDVDMTVEGRPSSSTDDLLLWYQALSAAEFEHSPVLAVEARSDGCASDSSLHYDAASVTTVP
jgi:hypothetical protein